MIYGTQVLICTVHESVPTTAFSLPNFNIEPEVNLKQNVNTVYIYKSIIFLFQVHRLNALKF